jgi:hypothetical protein
MSELKIKNEFTTIVKWKLANFSTVAARDDPKKQLFSKDFQLDSSAIKCCLEFYPTNINGADKNYSSLFLCIQDFSGHSSIKLCYDLWIENELGEKLKNLKVDVLYRILSLFLRDQAQTIGAIAILFITTRSTPSTISLSKMTLSFCALELFVEMPCRSCKQSSIAISGVLTRKD